MHEKTLDIWGRLFFGLLGLATMTVCLLIIARTWPVVGHRTLGDWIQSIVLLAIAASAAVLIRDALRGRIRVRDIKRAK
jgi:hypothetical protein